MAQIVINEISQNYTYNIGSNSYATVAMPITAAWGPGFVDPKTTGNTDIFGENSTSDSIEAALENAKFQHFTATQAGLESFVATYRGPESLYRLSKDYSYQMAMTLLTSGYDVLVCRVSCGNTAQSGAILMSTEYQSLYILDIKSTDDAKTKLGELNDSEKSTNTLYKVNITNDTDDTSTVEWYKYQLVQSSDDTYEFSKLDGEPEGTKFSIKAKYPGSFGNQLSVAIKAKVLSTSETGTNYYWNVITYVKDTSGIMTAVENLSFVTDESLSTDNLLYVDEITSNFLSISYLGTATGTDISTASTTIQLEKGSDAADNSGKEADAIKQSALKYAEFRYSAAGYDIKTISNVQYLDALNKLTTQDKVKLSTIEHNEWLYDAAYVVLDLITDKLSYNPNRVIVPGWDDQNIVGIGGTVPDTGLTQISPLHKKLMHVAFYSRCATAFLDIPRSEPRSEVYHEDDDGSNREGYAQMLARYGAQVEVASEGSTDIVKGLTNPLYSTHSALFAPWAQFTYVGTSKQNIASPSFIALMIQRAMILNQSLQYEWALPTNRTHTLRIGKPDYIVNNKLLNTWQSLEGVGVNVITEIPGSGITLWGNSTLYEVPPATYQALANLSTRYLVNAVEDVAYKCGLSITFQYNNSQAYNKFYAGVSPILDTMKNVGAITDYYIEMSADINGLDQVNANTIIGKIYLVVNGVVNDIYIDLIALPQGTDLNQYRG